MTDGYYATAPAYTYRRRTPIGVAILAVLLALAGIVTIIAGIALILGLGLGLTVPVSGVPPLAIGIGAIILGLIDLAVAWGLYELRLWAWWVAIIVEALSIVGAILTTNIISLAVSVIIFIYLIAVRNYFTYPLVAAPAAPAVPPPA